MTGKFLGGRISWWWRAGRISGLAAIAAALMLAWSWGAGATVVQAQTATPTPTVTLTPTVTPTPTSTPTPNTGCILEIRKSDSPSTVPEGGQITYTIRVENDGTADCQNVDVSDSIPSNTDCVSASVKTVPSGFDIGDVDIDGCDASGTVTWDFGNEADEELDDGDEVILEMVVELTSGADDGDTISNTACVDASGEIEVCDTERTNVGPPPTATKTPTKTPTSVPTVAATATQPPPVIPPPTSTPFGGPGGVVVVPRTGTGPGESGGVNQAMVLASLMAGGALVAVGGAAVLRRRRIR